MCIRDRPHPDRPTLSPARPGQWMPRPCTARGGPLRESQAATAPKRSDLDALNAWLQTTHEEPTAVGVTVFTRPESGGLGTPARLRFGTAAHYRSQSLDAAILLDAPDLNRSPNSGGALVHARSHTAFDRLHLSTQTAARFARTVVQLHHDRDARRGLGHRVDACLDDSHDLVPLALDVGEHGIGLVGEATRPYDADCLGAVSYTHLRAHETVLDLVCRLLLENKKK